MDSYGKFDVLDGSHPFQESLPDGCILYPVRELTGGTVLYFNFTLAKEMGLLPQNHSHKLNKKLEQQLLKTFCIRIINEYDQQSNKSFENKKPKQFMATRYLQLQHKSKSGTTSGDGRSIWNGVVTANGKTWDVSSRGTGVTRLAPGAVQANKNLKTGSGDFGYGCGLAETDELISSAVMSEIFHRQNIKTERTLLVIDCGKGHGIGVRAGHNLIRPAHLFLYLKQADHLNLKKAFNLFIQRRVQNKTLPSLHQNNHQYLLELLSLEFARFAAQLERHYIFTWLEWDGDNVLAEAGIIDYGSIRKMGLRHDQYRYDDVTRYSTNLNEQKNKAKITIQVFAQLIDFLKTSKKKPIEHFKNHSALEIFEKEFERHSLEIICGQLGFSKETSLLLMLKNRGLLLKVRDSLETFEKVKAHSKFEKLPDGINRKPLYSLSRVIKQFQNHFLKKGTLLAHKDISVAHSHALSIDVKGNSKRLFGSRKKILKKFFTDCLQLYAAAEKVILVENGQNESRPLFLIPTKDVDFYLTGNAAVLCVNEVLSKSKLRKPEETQTLIDLFISEFAENEGSGPTQIVTKRTAHDLVELLKLAERYKDDL